MKCDTKVSRVTVFFTSILLILSLVIPAIAGITLVPGQGLVLTPAEGVLLIPSNGLVLTPAEGLVLTPAEGLSITGLQGLVLTPAEAVTFAGLQGLVLTPAEGVGIQSIEPELAFLLDRLPDTSLINVYVTFYNIPGETEFSALIALGVIGGTKFRHLPIVQINATKSQIAAISALPSVRSIYASKTLDLFTHDTRVITGQSRVATDSALTAANGGLPVSGNGVTVAVLDTGIDATHPDLPYGSKVINNVRVLDLQSLPVGFVYPTSIELSNTDLVAGHGTFVSEIIAGSGQASGGYYGGMAPGARLVGISAGDVSLLFVLSGIDYILENRETSNTRVVNCSFGTTGIFDVNDPVNIATRILHDAGVTVVFSAGNNGDQPNSLNRYAVAPWVIGVGSVRKDGKLSSFSSRGAAGYGPFYPTLVAPGENIVSARAFGINLVGVTGLASILTSTQNDLLNIPLLYLPRYTMSSGTSFSAPHVSGTVALMLDANPSLSPDQIKAILQDTATPLLNYSRHEVGAGQLNTYAAVRAAALGLPYGQFRENFVSNVVSLTHQEPVGFAGEVAPGATYTTGFDIAQDAGFATVEVAWVSSGLLPGGLQITASHDGQSFTSKPATLLAGASLQRSGLTITEPSPGHWTVTLANTSNPITGTTLKFNGAIESIGAVYSGLTGIGSLSLSNQQAIKRALRTGLVTSSGSFDANAPANRLQVARALTLSTRMPQFLPNTPTFGDVTASASVFAETVTNSPFGNLLGASGGNFNPGGTIDRLSFAVATVKALGLEPLPLTAGLFNPGLSDWLSIPTWAKGYVATVINKRLMTADSTGKFKPFATLVQGDLAASAVAIQSAN